MKCLITGGTGFIGSRLALYLIKNGHEVRVLGQANTPVEEANNKELALNGIRVYLGSVIEPRSVEQALSDVDCVFHLAAAQHEANVPDEHFWNVNVEGTRNLLEASIAAGVKRFIHGSTIGVYGAGAEGELDEFSVVKPDNIYGKTKLAGEKLVLEYQDKLHVVVIRISETYGPRDRRLLKLFKIIKRKKFFRIGSGKNLHHVIYVDDLINGMMKAVVSDSSLGKVFVLSGKEILTTDEMINTIADVVGVKRPFLRAPLWPFLFVAGIMEITLRPLGIQPPLHRRRMDFFKKNFCFKQNYMIEELGFVPRWSFHNGVCQTAKWYEDQGLL